MIILLIKYFLGLEKLHIGAQIELIKIYEKRNLNLRIYVYKVCYHYIHKYFNRIRYLHDIKKEESYVTI